MFRFRSVRRPAKRKAAVAKPVIGYMCTHPEWLATGLRLVTPWDWADGVTWDAMVCADCGAARNENRLEPNESVTFDMREIEGLRFG